MSALAAESHRELLRWALCGAIVVLVHGAVAGAIAYWPEDEDDLNPASGMVVNLAPMPVAPNVISRDLPPGPEQHASEYMPDQTVEKVEETSEEPVETKDTKQVQPELASAENPEVVLEAAAPAKQEPTEASVRQDEQVAMAPPAVMGGEVPAAPMEGPVVVTNSTAIPTWKRQVSALIERNKRYPSAAQSRGEHGTAQLAFSLDRQGRVLASRIVKSSGSPRLDQETLEVVKRAQPFPAPPAEMVGIDMTVP